MSFVAMAAYKKEVSCSIFYGSAVTSCRHYFLVSSEASSLAGHLGLGKLIVLYDDNHVTIDGDTALSFTEDVAKRYESYGWHVQTILTYYTYVRYL